MFQMTGLGGLEPVERITTNDQTKESFSIPVRFCLRSRRFFTYLFIFFLEVDSFLPDGGISMGALLISTLREHVC